MSWRSDIRIKIYKLQDENVFGVKGPRKMKCIMPFCNSSNQYFEWRFDNVKIYI